MNVILTSQDVIEKMLAERESEMKVSNRWQEDISTFNETICTRRKFQIERYKIINQRMNH